MALTSEDKPKNERGLVGAWIEAIEDSEREEREYTELANDAEEAYRGDKKSKARVFNIFHSNTEILVPANYNSTPTPDIRRRFIDGDADEASKEGARLLERALSYSIDMYDFDDTMLSCVKDMMVPGRGLARVKYLPTFDEIGEVSYEETRCEYVPWRSFRRGPGRLWSDVSWIAFEHYLPQGEVAKLNPELAEKKQLYNYSAEAKSSEKEQGMHLPRFGKRARVWEVWDKDERKVHWICPDWTLQRITVMDDPLGLENFFPIPRPMVAISSPGCLIPVTPYSIYQHLIEELNAVTTRIKRLISQMRPRAGYAGVDTNIKLIAEAGDGELIPLQSIEGMQWTGGDLNKLLAWFPLDTVGKSLQVLMTHRDQLIQTIYNVTGISDILRGSSNPNETLGAQQIKAQMGSMRIQRLQAEVQRFARDLFELKAEIMSKRFSFDTLTQMTGLNYPTQEEKQAAEGMKAQYEQMAQQAQAQGQQPPPPPPDIAKQVQKVLESPTREEVEAILRDNATRNYKIDVESDSTIRGDVMRNMQQIGQYVTGIGQYIQAVGPAVQAGAMPLEVVVSQIGAFSRNLKLGKQAEDAIDQWEEQVREKSKQPQQEKPDPAMEKVKIDAEAKKMELQQKKELADADMQLTREKHGAEMQLTREKTQAELEMQREKLHGEMNLKRELGMMQAEQQAVQAQFTSELEARKLQSADEFQDRKLRSTEEFERRKIDSNHLLEQERIAASAKPTTQLQIGDDGAVGQAVETLTSMAASNSEAISMAAQMLGEAAQQMAQGAQMQAEATNNLARVMSAPKKLSKDPRTGEKVVMSVLQ
jgi:hypothetical protein